MNANPDGNEKVTGLGGVFFKGKNPESLLGWYEKHLGIPVKDGCAEFHWREKATPERLGRTVWSVFPEDTDYFGSPSQAFMFNYRVANLDRLLAQLRQSGVSVHKTENHDYGKFAWITDPEGNRIELWEPRES